MKQLKYKNVNVKVDEKLYDEVFQIDANVFEEVDMILSIYKDVKEIKYVCDEYNTYKVYVDEREFEFDY